MIRRRSALRYATAAALGTTMLPLAAQTSAYPQRMIRLVNPFAPGGALDTLARLLASKMQIALGQPVIVENKPGAGGNLGADFVAKSPPDGYNLVMVTSATHGSNAYLYGSQMPFDPIKDFATICITSVWANVLVVGPSLQQVRSLPDLVALAKASPGKLTFGSSAQGGSQHMAGELFKHAAGIDMLHVPYKGGAPAMQDLLAGRIDMIFNDMPGALQQVQAGKIRPLGVTTAQRSLVMPNVATIAEQGYPGFDLKSFHGVGAPAGTPRDVIDKLNHTIMDAMKQIEVRERLLSMGIDPLGLDVAESSRFLNTEFKKWGEVVRISGAKLS